MIHGFTPEEIIGLWALTSFLLGFFTGVFGTMVVSYLLKK